MRNHCKIPRPHTHGGGTAAGGPGQSLRSLCTTLEEQPGVGAVRGEAWGGRKSSERCGGDRKLKCRSRGMRQG